MKNLFPALLMILFTTIIICSCTKMDLKNPAATSLNSTKVTPDVPYCGTGYQWDFYLGKCVPVCPSGYHNDSITGACVINGGGIIISYAGVNITYYSSSQTLGFNSVSDVNTVLNQLDSNYENYNSNYENQYPNYTALQLDSLDSVNNFDQLATYRAFEAQFSGYTSQRAALENFETTWINNNFTGLDPDSLDYTIDNSENAICNNNYQVMISGTTYQWTANGFVVSGGPMSLVANATSGCFTNVHKKQPYYNSNMTRKADIKVAVNYWIVRGEAKGKVVCYRKKGNGKWAKSRLDVDVSAAGNIYTDNSCLGLTQVSLRKPAQGYLKRRELKTIARYLSPNKAYTESAQFQASFWCSSFAFGGSVSL